MVFPGEFDLTRSWQGEEPYLLVDEFRGKTDWCELDAGFLDQAPDGYGSALSFFSDEAFWFYIPAYMIHDLQGSLKHVQVVFHLTSGLTTSDKARKMAERQWGDRTWHDHALHKSSVFTEAQAGAVVGYLRQKSVHDDFRREVEEALANFWSAKAGL